MISDELMLKSALYGFLHLHCINKVKTAYNNRKGRSTAAACIADPEGRAGFIYIYS